MTSYEIYKSVMLLHSWGVKFSVSWKTINICLKRAKYLEEANLNTAEHESFSHFENFFYFWPHSRGWSHVIGVILIAEQLIIVCHCALNDCLQRQNAVYELKEGLLKFAVGQKLLACGVSSHPGIHGLIWDELHLNRHLRIQLFWRKNAHFTPGPVLNLLIFCRSRCGPRFERFLSVNPWSRQEAISGHKSVNGVPK